jgi:3-hydroxyacyl-CoA dehydrogenase
MRLLEIVRGRSTAPATLAAGLAVARTLAKAPVISRAAPGLIANRVMGPRGEAAIQLALEGESVEDIDQAMFDFGFPMGPFKLMDFLGLDVMGEGRAVRAVQSELVKLGRLGRKQAAGFYDYNPQSGACLSPVAVKAIADVAAAQGVKRKKRRGPTELLERLLFPVVNEAAATLEDGVAIRPSDIDVACVLGYRWPVYTGGPMFWADMLGLARVVDAMRAMGLTPGRLILEKAAKGERLTQR